MPSTTPPPNETATSTAPAVHRDVPTLDPAVAGALKKDDAGLVAAVVQQYDTLEVLMLGWMDEEALRRTLTSGRVTFYSRSRSEYWRKGDTSGHRQWVKGVALDCDGDALLVTVDQEGAACHTGSRTCFDGRAVPAVTASRPGSSADHDAEGH
jgi:phosphoribosyl-AMP cyclohydrolase